ncbi:MAG: hypothetical protein OEZ34_10950 [Spirochaetia bacterium]|nr:hypothetical protein [Spirochaetia bacterium]
MVNTNKTISSVPVDLWAATTRYETPGYESEKVQLGPAGSATQTGRLPVTGSGPFTVIIFDDVQTTPYAFGGTIYFTGNGSGGHRLAPADNIFTPCGGPTADGVAFVHSFILTPLATPYIPAPRFGLIGTGIGPLTAGIAPRNDEVSMIITNVSVETNITANYTAFTKATVDFCNCNASINVLDSASPSNVTRVLPGYFTDTNLGAAGGACGVRFI